MPKMTKKYSAAIRTARGMNDFPPNILRELADDADRLYQALADHYYQWNSDEGSWLYLPALPADQPSEIMRVRVWADVAIVERLADVVVKALEREGLIIQEKSVAYPCRPPKQLESRIYITAIPPRF